MGPSEAKGDILKAQSLCVKQRPRPTMVVAGKVSGRQEKRKWEVCPHSALV